MRSPEGYILGVIAESHNVTGQGDPSRTECIGWNNVRRISSSSISGMSISSSSAVCCLDSRVRSAIPDKACRAGFSRIRFPIQKNAPVRGRQECCGRSGSLQDTRPAPSFFARAPRRASVRLLLPDDPAVFVELLARLVYPRAALAAPRVCIDRAALSPRARPILGPASDWTRRANSSGSH